MSEPTAVPATGAAIGDAPTTLDRPDLPIKRISTAMLIIGASGMGKTSLLETFATYLWETYGRVLFLYSWDGGAIPTNIQKRMKQGIIRFWRVRTRSAMGLGIDTLYKATKGYVPRTINPETGETDPSVTMIPPVQSRHDASCPKGHPLQTVAYLALLQPMYCSECKALIPRESMIIQSVSRRTKGLELIGGVAFDGLSSMSNVVMDHMDHARGAGDIGGEKPAFGGVVISGDTKLGGNNRADVGFGQSRAQQFVNNSLSIPFLVEGPIFTALTAEASEEGLPIVGAKLPGRAATDEASAWFGNVLEAGIYKNPDNGDEHRALYILPFTDNQGRKHLLKTSGSPGSMPDKLFDPPIKDKKAFEGFNLGLYLKMLDDDLRKALANQERLTPDTTSYGDDAPAVQAHAAPAPPTTALPQPGTATGQVPKVPAGPLGANIGTAGSQPAPASPAQQQTPAAPPAPTPRRRRAGAATAAPAAAAPAPPQQAPQQQTLPAPAAETAPATQAAQPAAAQAAPTNAAPPPPPGLRPPQRAPGT